MPKKHLKPTDTLNAVMVDKDRILKIHNLYLKPSDFQGSHLPPEDLVSFFCETMRLAQVILKGVASSESTFLS